MGERVVVRQRVASAGFVLAGVLGTHAALGDEFRVGVQAGVPSWSFDVGVSALGRSTGLDPDVEPSIGVAGQYIIGSSESDGGFYVGVEGSFGTESASATDRLELLGASIDVMAETAWVVDVAWLAGFSLGETAALGGLGDLTVFGSVGASYAKGAIGVSVPDLDLAGGDEGKHFGWKAGAGVEFAIGKSATLQVRANYADYEDRTYRDQGVSLEVEPDAFELRATLLYRFDYCGLFRC